ncbi:hypothetical protein JJJ17_09695 [Paracoccus caeni]|uniref:Aspartate carbamoyltransferase catalytic subunit n=1 Tax=Paracoccus caeni TaxID=657651 RepID=A0A934VUU3_9RHOB|nr:hypothetical protein [Paracoccus caeni]MBK4216196.1 hypothetical protein [Paracoccus caeni]
MSQAATGINWAESLHPGEQVLWQGAPIGPGRPDLPVRFFSLLGTILSLGSLLFILIAFLGRSQPDFVAGFGGIGAVALIVGLTCRFLPRRLQIARLRRSRYALTDRRMLAHDGAKLRDWPITPKLELEVLRDSVLVAPPEDPRLPNRPYRETGFIAIAEPRQVADMIKDIQSRQAGRTETAP